MARRPTDSDPRTARSTASNMASSTATGDHLPAGGTTTLWVLWATYGSFYLCRTNLSAALPGIEAEFGFAKTDMAIVLMALKIVYGIGQLINGQLAERISPRWMLGAGMLTSAALNCVFGVGASIWFFTFVWAMNGYSQALGWTPTMRVVANWMPAPTRGRSIGIIGTGYMIGASASYIVAGWAADAWGWRAALYVPSLILFASYLHMVALLVVAPTDATDGSRLAADAPRSGTTKPAVRPFRETLRLTLTNGDLWLLALALGLLNACRYGYLDWGVSLIHEVAHESAVAAAGATAGTATGELQPESVGRSAIKFAILPAGGILGALGAGWVSDRLLGGRRAPMICGMLIALAALTVFFRSAVEMGSFATVITLFLIGIMIFGPQVLLVGTAPTDMAKGGTVAAAVGFVNFIGYMGASAGDWFTAQIADSDTGWDGVYWLWATWALIAAGCSAVLWNRSAVRETSQDDMQDQDHIQESNR